jgi:single-stranded DNA-binding protein
MNRVFLRGYVKFIQRTKDKGSLSFQLAYPLYKMTDGKWKFGYIKCWGGGSIPMYVDKNKIFDGDAVIVEGALNYSEYVNKEGATIKQTSITIYRIDPLKNEEKLIEVKEVKVEVEDDGLPF